MKQYVKKLYQKLVSDLYRRLSAHSDNLKSNLLGEQQGQLILRNQYQFLYRNGLPKDWFFECGFRKYSQNSEDGILLAIFSLIGTINKTAVEICASNGIECNTANLIINHGWQALLFDGDLASIEQGEAFYKSHPDTFTLPPRFARSWITRDNINSLIESNGIIGEIDLLSVDMDGVDYWIWDAIDCVTPRVVVVEVQCIWGLEKSVTVPYNKAFKTEFIEGFGVYSGASLQAFITLAHKKGYRLIALEKYGFNAFFMRNDIGMDLFPAIDIAGYETIPFVKWAKNKFLHLIENKPWETV